MAATSPLSNFLSLFTQPKPPKTILPTHYLSLPTKTTQKNNTTSLFSDSKNSTQVTQQLCNDDTVLPLVCPSLAYSNTLFFRSGYNVQVIVDENEHEERLIGRFRREVMRAGIIQECKRRRFHENKQDEDKRKTREAAKRNRRRRTPFVPRGGPQDKEAAAKSKKAEDDDDNWELPAGESLPN